MTTTAMATGTTRTPITRNLGTPTKGRLPDPPA